MSTTRVTNLSDKTICVTGGEGFLGRSSRRLADKGLRKFLRFVMPNTTCCSAKTSSVCTAM